MHGTLYLASVCVYVFGPVYAIYPDQRLSVFGPPPPSVRGKVCPCMDIAACGESVHVHYIRQSV